MSTMPTIPMIAPDGSIGDVPIHRTNEASQQGYKVGKEVELNGQKEVIPFERYGDFMKQHGPITGTDAPPMESPRKGFVQSLLEATPLPAVYDAVTSPVESAKGLFKTLRDTQAYYDDAVAKGDGIAAQGKIIGGAIPGAAAVDQVKQGNYTGAAGTVAGTLASFLLPKAIPKVAGLAADGIADARIPRVVDPVAASETAARAVTKAVNPAPPGMPNFIDAVQQHGGDVVKYIRDKGLRVDGVLDYAKAARGAAQEAYEQYRNYLDPLTDKRVPVGPQYQGGGAGDVRTGTGLNEMRTVGRNAPLGEIDKRISQINDLTHKADTGKATIDTPTRFALESEHAALTDTLHRAIAESIGGDITPDDVASLRRKFGKLNTIADQAELSVNHRMGIEAGQEQGSKMKEHTLSGVAMDVANKVFRGGPNGIADRALVRAAGSSALKPSNLKLANAIMQSKQVIQ